MWQSLRYGWVALAAMVVVGATIFVAGNTRQTIQPVDVVEIVLGTYERCLATQYATNPLYRVNPNDILMAAFTNSYTNVSGFTTSIVNGVAITNGWTNYYVVSNWFTLTNSFTWRVNKEMLDATDAAIYALIPYYADTNFSLTDSNPNVSDVRLTVSKLFSRLHVGDGTSLFTRTPRMVVTNLDGTNPPAICTNAATYGTTMGWPIYQTNLVERYKVLNALTRTLDAPARAINGSSRNKTIRYNVDLNKEIYSNLTTHSEETFYSPRWIAELCGLPPTPNPPLTNYVYVGGDGTNPLVTWAQSKDNVFPWYFYHYTNNFNVPLDTTTFVEVSTNTSNLGAGSMCQVTYELTQRFISGDPSLYNYPLFNFYIVELLQYSTYVWDDMINTNIDMLAKAVFGKPVPSIFQQLTEVVDPTNGSSATWSKPREWENTIGSHFNELSHMSNTNWWRMNDVDVETNPALGYTQIQFGKGLVPLALDGSLPESMWPDEPSKGVGYTNNAGSIGRARGNQMLFSYNGQSMILMLKDWKFNYCTNRYW